MRKLSENITVNYLSKTDRVEYLGIEWHQVIHTDDFEDNCEKITLPNLSVTRNCANTALVDFLFYTSEAYQSNILKTVANKLNQQFVLFCKNNPTFDQKQVSIIGHSMGSMISFDILANRQGIKGYRNDIPSLKFEPQTLFAL